MFILLSKVGTYAIIVAVSAIVGLGIGTWIAWRRIKKK